MISTDELSAKQLAFPELRGALPELPCQKGEPVFEEPWHAQAFAMTLALYNQGVFTWKEWAEMLSRTIREAQAAGDLDTGKTHYEHWLGALEHMAAAKGLVSGELLSFRMEEWQEAARRTPHGNPIELKRD